MYIRKKKTQLKTYERKRKSNFMRYVSTEKIGILRWRCGHIRNDKIHNDCIQGNAFEAPIEKKMKKIN